MRILGLIVTSCLAVLLPTNSFALGLGEIEVNSFLNQPLSAEIEVISARPGEIDDLLVSLASREAFSRAGLARTHNLSEFKFAVKKSEDGERATIFVTTRGSIKEPFLNFLIEADWSKGRVLREFTILLDPPFYADQSATTDSSTQPVIEAVGVAPVAESGAPAETESIETIPEPIALAEDAELEPAQPEPAQPEPADDAYAVTEASNSNENNISVSKGDTLWGIASDYKDQGYSMAQVMLAFQRANPDAFNDGNINNMKAGVVLRAPSVDELNAIRQQEANAEVLVQNGLWDEYAERVSGVSPAVASEDGGAEAEMVAEKDSTEPEGELSLLLPGDGETESTGIGDTDDADAVRNRLGIAEEELDASRIENQELESRIAELQARLSKVEELQKMVEIEDDSLAQMQADQAQQIEEQAATESMNDTVEADEEALLKEEALLEELLTNELAAQAEEEVVVEGGAAEAAIGDDAMTDEAAPDDTMADETASEAVDTASQLPTPVTEPVDRAPSIFDGILPPNIIDMIPSMPAMGGIPNDPVIIGAVGGAIILLLILVVLKRRKTSSDDESSIRASDDEDLLASVDEEELTPIHLAGGGEADIEIAAEGDVAPEPAEVESHDDFSPVPTDDMPESEAAAPATEVGEQDDVLNEVDVYLAYGLYDNAEELLNSSLLENSDRGDYRAKLLDTHFATKNVDAFNKEAEKFKSMGDAASPYWDRVQVMGFELAPDNALFSDAKTSDLKAADLDIPKPQEADFDFGASDDGDADFSTTGFNFNEDDFADTLNINDEDRVAETQRISQLDEFPEFDDDEDTNIAAESTLDPIGDIPMEAGVDSPTDTILDFSDDVDDELTFSIDSDSSGSAEGDPVEPDQPEESEMAVMDTVVVSPGPEIETGLMESLTESSGPDDESDDSIDLGMEETAMMNLDDDETSLATAELNLDTAELPIVMDDTAELPIAVDNYDGDDDISIIDFGGGDSDEPSEFTGLAEDEGDDLVVMDIDVDDAGDPGTDTFAPGDFEEPTAVVDGISDIDDIGDLMLPDDVDEVSTKLDLARAFIDMGDTEGARGSLEEVVSEGNEEQQAEAKSLLDQI